MVNPDVFLGAGFWQQGQAGWQAGQEAGAVGSGGVVGVGQPWVPVVVAGLGEG